jgi:riboflavin synthase|tara:strand:- start:429 stop:1013 length:585 start_codon:yes stop_codon:yes gene_type:complete
MFNGIITKQGKIEKIVKQSKNSILLLKSNMKFNQREIGSSISCNGACLTLYKVKKNIIYFFLSNETLGRSTFENSRVGENVNLEKSIAFGKRISGHYLQGHIDSTSKILKIKKIGKTWFIKFSTNKKDMKYLVEKGSIGINGVSLTISKLFKNAFEISVIPHTLKLTNLSNLKKGNKVNIEFDLVGKYLNNIYN